MESSGSWVGTLGSGLCQSKWVVYKTAEFREVDLKFVFLGKLLLLSKKDLSFLVVSGLRFWVSFTLGFFCGVVFLID